MNEVKRPDEVYVNCNGTRIKLTSDPTLAPGEFRIERPRTIDDIPIDPTSGMRVPRDAEDWDVMLAAAGIVATACARCSHAFTSRPDGFVDEALEAEIAAHQERCFVAGDHIRWYPHGSDSDGDLVHVGQFIDGVVSDNGRTCMRVMAVAGPVGGGVLGRPRIGGTVDWSVSPGTIRRIPRPQQVEVVTTCPGYNAVFTIEPDPPDLQARQARRVAELYVAEAKHIAATPLPEHHAARIRAMAERCRQPAPVLYDGLTAEQCLERDRQRRQEDSTSAWRSHVRPSADQRAVVSAHWSAQLRAKLAASDVVERCRVRVQLQCDEDEPW